jgi:hypothetical protein
MRLRSGKRGRLVKWEYDGTLALLHIARACATCSTTTSSLLQSRSHPVTLRAESEIMVNIDLHSLYADSPVPFRLASGQRSRVCAGIQYIEGTFPCSFIHIAKTLT